MAISVSKARQVANEFKQHMDNVDPKPQDLVGMANEFANFVDQNYPDDNDLRQLAQMGQQKA